ncbi:GNAT family N-acetyltransferase [soil metagenome]
MHNVQITRIDPADLEQVIELFAHALYGGNIDDAQAHLADHRKGDGDTWLAHVDGLFAGFITIRWQSNNPRFRADNIPLIHHLEVFDGFRRQGIAERLMDEAEQLIATRAQQVGITVGLFDAYGPAQRLYAKRGYIPDGRGLCQGQRPLKQGETVTIDHDIILWLTKNLSTSEERNHAQNDGDE